MRKLLLILLISFSVFSQKKQPKVGLVLSGGGAKGFAHIGVLKAIEKAGVQIDYIAGTSMGAIIGALYASGYTPSQIEGLIRETDFTQLLQDKIPRRNTPLFNKVHQEKYALTIPIGKTGISLPRGVSRGQNVRNYFTELFSRLDNVTDFSKLPIPFLCVATDIESGKKVVLEDGSLNLAIQASGAFPTLLHPVEIGDKLLIDGGVVDNFPVSELKKRGMDIIIGLDVQDELANREGLKSAIDLLNQIIAFQIFKRSQEQKKEVDVYVHPIIKGFSVISFDKSDQIIENGVIEGAKFTSDFDSIAALQPVKRKKKKIVINEDRFLIEKILVEGNKNYNMANILGTMQLKVGDSVSHKSITKNINRLYATNNFRTIDYNFNKTEKGKILCIKLKETKERSFLRLGLHYDNIFGSGLLANYTHKRILTNNDILSLDVVMGDNLRYDLNYFVDNGLHWGFGIGSSYKSFDANINYLSSTVNKLNINFYELVNRAYVQTKFNRKYALTLGIDHRLLQANSETILYKNKPVSYEDSSYGIVFANVKIDDFNKSYYPTKGVYFSSTFDWVVVSDHNRKSVDFAIVEKFKPFTQLYGKFSAVNTFFNRISLQHTFEGGITMGNVPTSAFSYKIGSYNQNLPYNFVPFYGSDVAEFKRNNFVKGAVELRYNFYGKHHFIANADFIRMDKAKFMKGPLFENIYGGYALGYGLETFLGPIELKYSWSSKAQKKGAVLFNLGFWF